MKRFALFVQGITVLFLIAAVLPGCARAAKDTTGFTMEDSITVGKPLEETWQDTKAVLREMEMDIYTRDKRGEFVAFTPMKRQLYVGTPNRTKLTIVLSEATANSTTVSIQTVAQVYGVTLLTYPDWHDRQAPHNNEAVAIIEALKAKAS
ncbi:MAG TPA: hypothetical protein PLJ47_12010 [Candidatus Hydrogenedentes bacterium]|nr:hypothetical protein [Candidatus Hydrogenedentota bacterium]HRK35310.1 hypothetical protein [Candidatus Hydrogenedentota bacterium]